MFLKLCCFLSIAVCIVPSVYGNIKCYSSAMPTEGGVAVAADGYETLDECVSCGARYTTEYGSTVVTKSCSKIDMELGCQHLNIGTEMISDLCYCNDRDFCNASTKLVYASPLIIASLIITKLFAL